MRIRLYPRRTCVDRIGAITGDPATGSAAAALGARVREFGSMAVPGRLVVRQGRHVGRAGVPLVDVPSTGGLVATGTRRRSFPDPPS